MIRQKGVFFVVVLIVLGLNDVSAQQKPPNSPPSSDSLFMQKKDEVSPSFFQKLFSGKLNWNFVATPLIGYQPETSWGFGVAGAYYIKPETKDGKTGVLGFDATYTLKKQFNINVNTTIYFGKNQKWVLYSKTGYGHSPDDFFGVGNEMANLLLDNTGNLAPIRYNSHKFYITLQPQRYIWGHWLLGLNLDVRWEEVSGLDKSLQQTYNIAGLDEYLMIGVGGLLSYDSRNNIFYPDKGIFFKGVLSHYDKILGSSYRMLKAQVDFRQYFKIYKEIIFAYQVVSETVFADHKPFQMLSTIGGVDIVRGIRQNQWKDDMMAAVQAEVRMPIWKIIKASAFCSIGDVYNLESWHFATPKIGYGVGLRIQFNNSKAHLRFDVARQNFSRGFAFYITTNEAF